VQLRKFLSGQQANQSNNQHFLQAEKEPEPNSIICAFHSVDCMMILANLPYVSHYIRSCTVEEDHQG
jgi:hypothetical protein